MRKATLNALAATLMLAAAAPLTAAGDAAYLYCYATESDIQVYYFSSVFAKENPTFSMGAENAFRSHVNARLAEGLVDFVLCMGPYESRTEAMNELNDHITTARHDGNDIVGSRWRYRGD